MIKCKIIQQFSLTKFMNGGNMQLLTITVKERGRDDAEKEQTTKRKALASHQKKLGIVSAAFAGIGAVDLFQLSANVWCAHRF